MSKMYESLKLKMAEAVTDLKNREPVRVFYDGEFLVIKTKRGEIAVDLTPAEMKVLSSINDGPTEDAWVKATMGRAE